MLMPSVLFRFLQLAHWEELLSCQQILPIALMVVAMTLPHPPLANEEQKLCLCHLRTGSI